MVLDMLPFWRRGAVLTLPFFPFFFLSFPLPRPGARGELVKSAAIHCVRIIIQVLLGLPWEGDGGGVGVKWL